MRRRFESCHPDDYYYCYFFHKRFFIIGNYAKRRDIISLNMLQVNQQSCMA